MALDRDGFRKKSICKVEEVQIPEWESSCFIRQITSGERDRFEGKNLELKGIQRYDDLRAKFLLLTLSDSAGKRLFGDEDLAELSNLPGPVADLIWERAWKFNRMAKEDLDGLVKNSKAGPAAG